LSPSAGGRATAGRPRADPGRAVQGVVGQHEATELLLYSLFAGGHCLITGAPGLAKTLLVRSLAQMFHLRFQRIQFTPDLMPADITGTEILEDDRARAGRDPVRQGAGLSPTGGLADEINRTPPKTQAALLEAMQEHQVSGGGSAVSRWTAARSSSSPRRTRSRWRGTYPRAPMAQLDRFMFTWAVDYPAAGRQSRFVKRTRRAARTVEPLHGAGRAGVPRRRPAGPVAEDSSVRASAGPARPAPGGRPTS
jgi:MoxR-like ATPase